MVPLTTVKKRTGIICSHGAILPYSPLPSVLGHIWWASSVHVRCKLSMSCVFVLCLAVFFSCGPISQLLWQKICSFTNSRLKCYTLYKTVHSNNLPLVHIRTLLIATFSTSTSFVLPLFCPVVHNQGTPSLSILCLSCVRCAKSYSLLS